MEFIFLSYLKMLKFKNEKFYEVYYFDNILLHEIFAYTLKERQHLITRGKYDFRISFYINTM